MKSNKKETDAVKHTVFISHSSKDKKIADAICHYLEEAGIPCWIAPRDIQTSDWAGSIMKGIRTCDVFVVILSESSIPSPEVTKEVTEATRVCQYILPFKIDEEMLNDRLRYHLAPYHWLDAINPPLERHIQTLSEWIKNLSAEDAVYQNTGRQKLVSANVMPKSFFIGRDEEINKIHELLSEAHILFLQGMGGIGKSEIAKGYAKAFAEDYDTVLFVNYRSNILDMINGDEIEIENFQRNLSYGKDAESDEAFFRRKLKAVKSLSNNRTLMIVDNFNVEYDEHLEDLVSGPYRILFTTRYEHDDYPCLPIGAIKDLEMVYRLFVKNYGRSVSPKDKDVIYDLLNLVCCHTITVELIAKQMRASFMSPLKMLEKLKESGTNSGLKESVRYAGNVKNAFDFIKNLFHLSALCESEKDILKHMCLVPPSGIAAERFLKYLNLESYEDVNSLIAKSWLMLEEETSFLKMHPIICDVVREQLKPDQTSCKQYILGVWESVKDAWWQTVEERSECWPYADYILRYYGEPTQELLEQYIDFSNIAWICSQFSLAVESAKKNYAFVLKNCGDAGYKPAYAARGIAGAYYNAGKDKEAEPYYFLALEHMLKKPEENYTELGHIYQKVARCAYMGHDFAQGEYYLNCSLEAFEKAVQAKEPIEPIAPVDSYVYFARLNMEKEDYQTAVSYAQQAYDMLYAWKNCEVTSSAYALSDMGICYSRLGEYEKAAKYLQRALELNIRFNGEASMITVRTKEAIADNLANQGKTGEAKNAYLMLELELEKNFGSECSACVRISEKGKAL